MWRGGDNRLGAATVLSVFPACHAEWRDDGAGGQSAVVPVGWSKRHSVNLA